MKNLKKIVNEKKKKTCNDRLVISLDDPLLKLWQIFVVIISFVSSIIYTFYAAFGGPDLNFNNMERIAITVTEIIMFMDIIIQFFIEYIPDNKYKTERSFYLIALRYLQGRFLIDFIQIVPFEYLIEETGYNNLFYIVRAFRMEKALNYVSINSFMKVVKIIFNKRLQYLVKNQKLDSNGKELGGNETDKNNINELLIINQFFKVSKLVIFISVVSYVMGLGWYIFCDLTRIENPTDQDPSFLDRFNLKAHNKYEKGLIVTYWAFTTLSTVGLGDYFPSSNIERAFSSLLLLLSVCIFSYILGNYITILYSIKELN